MVTRSQLKSELRGAYAEFLACFLFVFFGAGSVCGAVSATADVGPVEPVNYALSFGFSITILAFAIGDVSGGHINPAVTLALAITRNVTPTRAALYVVFQLLGGIAGGGVLYGAVGKDNYHSGIGLAADIKPEGGFALEFVGTLLLIFVVFNVAVWAGKPLDNDLAGSTVSALAPIPIGWALMVAHLTLGPFTGCGINPMRVVGAVIFEEEEWWVRHDGVFWIYICGPFLASVVGPALYFSLYGQFKPGSAGKTHADAPGEDDSNKVKDYKAGS